MKPPRKMSPQVLNKTPTHTGKDREGTSLFPLDFKSGYDTQHYCSHFVILREARLRKATTQRDGEQSNRKNLCDDSAKCWS